MFYRFTLIISLFLFINSEALWGQRLEVAWQQDSLMNAEAIYYFELKGPEYQLVMIEAGQQTSEFNLEAGQYNWSISGWGVLPQKGSFEIEYNENVALIIEIKNQQHALNQVDIFGQIDEDTDATARTIERNASQVLNVISAQSISHSPDINVANVLERVSGVSMEASSPGQGKYAVLRGMDKRYNYTLVNGLKVPSPDNKHRYIPLDIFPASMLDRLEVIKSLTAKDEGDAIGGATNLILKNTPDELKAEILIAATLDHHLLKGANKGYAHRKINDSSPYEEYGKDYVASLSDFNFLSHLPKTSQRRLGWMQQGLVSNRFVHKKLGVTLAWSLQETLSKEHQRLFGFEKVDSFQGVTLNQQEEADYFQREWRQGLQAAIDYRINHEHELKLLVGNTLQTRNQIRERKTVQLTIGGYDPELGNATLGYETRTRTQKQSIFFAHMQGVHQWSNRQKTSWNIQWAEAKEDTPDNTYLPVLGQRVGHHEAKTYPRDARKRWEHHQDNDLTLKVQHEAQFKWANIYIGVLGRSKHRKNFYNQYQFRPKNSHALYGEDFEHLNSLEWQLINPRGSVASAMNYQADEKVIAGYVMAEKTYQKIQWVAGVRLEKTKQGYAMDFPIGEEHPEGQQNYNDLLPSMQLKYNTGVNHHLRLAYFKAINRPGFFEIVPYKIVHEDYQERGNSNLERAIAHNLDLRWECFPNRVDQIMIGGFYKHIKDPIEYTLQRDPVRGQDVFISPGNFGIAQNYGLEIDVIKQWKWLGFKANYTFTHSSMTTDKVKRIRNEEGDLQLINVSQTRPLYAQAAHMGNVVISTDFSAQGLYFQVATNYIGSRIVTISEFYENDIWSKPQMTIDIAAEWKILPQWTLFAKVNNLWKSDYQTFIKQGYHNESMIPYQQITSNQTQIAHQYQQPFYLLGIKWNL